jgi:hypothetical protein
MMKSSNILMMAVLIAGTGSNLFAVPTITNTSNEIVTVRFLDANKQLLGAVRANTWST